MMHALYHEKMAISDLIMNTEVIIIIILINTAFVIILYMYIYLCSENYNLYKYIYYISTPLSVKQ